MSRLARTPAIAEAWSGLGDYLERRMRDLSGEIRDYPTPIARCDQQLAKLLEQRAGIHERLDLMRHVASQGPAGCGVPTPEMARALLGAGAATDDDAEREHLDRLGRALAPAP